MEHRLGRPVLIKISINPDYVLRARERERELEEERGEKREGERERGGERELLWTTNNIRNT